MANKKITALPAFSGIPASNDVVPIVDVSGTATTKKVSLANIVNLANVGNLRAANNLSDVANATTSRTNLGLGSAAVANTGTSNGNVVVLDAVGLPAVDGSQLTGINVAFTDILNKTANHTLVDSDSGKVIFCNSSSRIDITVPSGLTSGFNCRVVQGGTGRVRFLTSGVTINGYTSGSNTPNAVLGQHGVADLVPTGSNAYTLAGDIDYLFIYGNTKSLGLDGVDDWMNVGNIAELNSVTSYSISYWVRENPAMIGQSGYHFSANTAVPASSAVEFYSTIFSFTTKLTNGIKAITTTRPSNDVWHCIVVSFGSSTTKMYVDGVLKTSTNQGATTTDGSIGNNFRIGARLNGTGDLNGYIDEFAIYSEALTDGSVSVGATAIGQVGDIFNGRSSGGSGGTSGTPGDLTSFQGSGNGGLAHWWRFEDSPNDIIGSNNGTLNGTTYSSETP